MDRNGVIHMSKAKIALYTLAISAIYGSGLLITANQSVSNALLTSATSKPTLMPTLKPTLKPTLMPTLKPTLKPTSPPASTSLYKDGAYTGSGTNRFGTVEVAVSIKNGEISNVDITNCTTHYSQSRIDPVLPKEVLQKQSADIKFVSRATYSSEDFQYAVMEALNQAKNV